MLRRLIVPLLLLPALAASQTPAQANLPVTAVALFSSGVGYFEHAGSVRGNGSSELRFKTAQINDVLKSLVLQDLDGGRVSAVSYPSQDPLEKTLKSFQVDVTGNPSLAALLNQLRGGRVTVVSQADRISGTILGVEMRPKAADRGESIDEPVLNILAGGLIRSIPLPGVTSLSLDDPQLQTELAQALTALSQSRDQDKKPVTISFSGTGDRRVRLGYVVETPIWKTSYRLLLDNGAGRLQGWAIVENQTESDWNGVSLSLVSGRPISFVMDLYQPLYMPRPTVVPELYASLRPQTYEDGLAAARERAPLAAPAGGRGGGGGGGRGGIGRDSLGRPLALNLDAVTATSSVGGRAAGTMVPFSVSAKTEPLDPFSSVRSVASATSLGELFQYTVSNVTLARQKSAMLPIVTDSVRIERVSIYNASALASNPLTGVRIRNITGKHLLQGPVTVLDENSYAGDARIDDVPPGQERLVSYGIDLEMKVDNTKNTNTTAITGGRIVNGVLFVDRRLVATQDYLADNKSTRDKTLIIEHPIRQGWKLLDTTRLAETTRNVYRFKGVAAAGKVTTLTVKEELVTTQRFAILTDDPGTLQLYSRTGEIPAAVRDALTRAAQMRAAIVDVERQVNARSQQITEINQEQERMRENMKTVSQSSDYYNRLLAKLNEQESTIERLQRERGDLVSRRDALRRDLESYLGTLSLG